jgi:predicted nucleic acid-binding Zn ribbon protein
MMKMCPLCNTEMPERYNYCYQCGEYVGQTAPLQPGAGDPVAEKRYRQQERVIHYGCLTLIIVWSVFGLWFFFNMNR